MAIRQPYSNTVDRYAANDGVWCELYSSLRPYILGWVYSSGVSSWHGQENDIADDILQEAVIRTLKYTKLVESGRSLPINSMTCFGRTVAHNHFRDLRRRELRLVRPNIQEASFVVQDEEEDPADIALDRLMRISLLMVLARIIVDFPSKQRTALLIDLANHADLSGEQSHLHKVFLEVGIELKDYCHILSPDPLERSRHAASLSMAYKRLRQVFSRQTHESLV